MTLQDHYDKGKSTMTLQDHYEEGKSTMTLQDHCDEVNLTMTLQDHCEVNVDTTRSLQKLGVHSPCQRMPLIRLWYLCTAESVSQVHSIQSQHLNCRTVYQQTLGA